MEEVIEDVVTTTADVEIPAQEVLAEAVKPKVLNVKKGTCDNCDGLSQCSGCTQCSQIFGA